MWRSPLFLTEEKQDRKTQSNIKHMSLNNFGRCNRSSDLLGTRRLVLKSRKQVDLFFCKAQVHSPVCEKKVLWKKTDKRKILPVDFFWLKVSSYTYVLKICIGTISSWQDREKTIKYISNHEKVRRQLQTKHDMKYDRS